MVMSGMKGYPLKCEGCGHKDAIIFNEVKDQLKEMAFRIKKYKKCPQCGAKMKIDPNGQICF